MKEITINLPRSKSIFNRLQILSAINGEILSINDNDCTDIQIMHENLKTNTIVKDAYNCGTCMRFLTAYYSLLDKDIILGGNERMCNRPIKDLVNQLRNLGAKIEYIGKDGFPPLKIKGFNKDNLVDRCDIDTNISSQYITALMLIGPYLKNGLDIYFDGNKIPYPYIKMTENIMNKAGYDVICKDNHISIKKVNNFIDLNNIDELDWSAASYFYEACALYHKPIFLKGLHYKDSCQGDKACLDIFKLLGVVSIEEEDGIHISYDDANQVEMLEYSFIDNPDLLMAVVVTCCAKKIHFKFKVSKALNEKECKRIDVLISELKKFGYHLFYNKNTEELYLNEIEDINEETRIFLYSHLDHRIVMSMIFLEEYLPNFSMFDDISCVEKSFKNFIHEYVKYIKN